MQMAQEVESAETGRSQAQRLRDVLLQERDTLAEQLQEAHEALQARRVLAVPLTRRFARKEARLGCACAAAAASRSAPSRPVCPPQSVQQEGSAKDSALAALVESQQMLQGELQQALDRLQTAGGMTGARARTCLRLFLPGTCDVRARIAKRAVGVAGGGEEAQVLRAQLEELEVSRSSAVAERDETSANLQELVVQVGGVHCAR